jgi:membrane associated rhomboid family serine protease
MARGRSVEELLSFGGRAPPAVGGLIAALVLLSIAAKLSGSLAAALALAPPAVLSGEVWRLATWTLVDLDPISVIFGGLMLYWFGRDLCYAWGPRRFLVTYFVLGAAAGLGTALLALFFPSLMGMAWIGTWPVLSALTVAWGLLFPERQILLYMVLPITGRALVWLTVGLTAFFAIFQGLRLQVPHLLAQGLMFLWFRGFSLRGAWQSFRIRQGERRLRRRARHLKVVKKNGAAGDPPRWIN